jgi:DNA-binding HxlR family transcriptional regulator
MSSDEQIENAVDQIGKSFSLTVTERINTQPRFRREILRQVVECVESDDLLVAKKMLDQVVEADEGFDK